MVQTTIESVLTTVKFRNDCETKRQEMIQKTEWLLLNLEDAPDDTILAADTITCVRELA